MQISMVAVGRLMENAYAERLICALKSKRKST